MAGKRPDTDPPPAATTAMAMVITMAVVAVGTTGLSTGCAVFSQDSMDPQQRQVYRVALDRLVRGHVYAMRCQALLPLAEEMLWEAGYEEIDYEPGKTGLGTEWRQVEGQTISHELQAHEVGADDCAVQILRRHQSGSTADQHRDVDLELVLLEFIDDDEAQRLRNQARQQAQEATSQ